MQYSEKLVHFVKTLEGYRQFPYKDIGGKLTVGYGHTGENVSLKFVSESDAELILREDLNEHLADMKIFIKNADTLQQHMIDSLLSFAFNVGIFKFAKSTLLKRLNSGKFNQAADELLRWNKYRINNRVLVSKGLTNRRVKERQVFLIGEAEGYEIS